MSTRAVNQFGVVFGFSVPANYRKGSQREKNARLNDLNFNQQFNVEKLNHVMKKIQSATSSHFEVRANDLIDNFNSRLLVEKCKAVGLSEDVVKRVNCLVYEYNTTYKELSKTVEKEKLDRLIDPLVLLEQQLLKLDKTLNSLYERAQNLYQERQNLHSNPAQAQQIADEEDCVCDEIMLNNSMHVSLYEKFQRLASESQFIAYKKKAGIYSSQ